MKVCIGTSNTLRYPQGGHLWVFINWALGFVGNGCRVLWLDVYDPKAPVEQVRAELDRLRQRIRPFGLDDCIVLTPSDGSSSRPDLRVPGAEVLDGCDLLFDLRYDLPASVIDRFRRTALLDIDPGMLQISLKQKQYDLQPHDFYFTIGESVAENRGGFPTLGYHWVHLPPAVALDQWPVVEVPSGAPLSTVSHWYMDQWMVEDNGLWYKNDKREGFLPFLDLPRHSPLPLELAIHLAGDTVEHDALTARGWRVREAHEVAATPQSFRAYVQQSAGEFGCAKPSYVRHQTSWISDRTLCYLASGRPAVIQDTGPSRLLDGRQGVLRFSTFDQAVDALKELSENYDQHSRAARQLAEEHFSATKVARRVLELCA